MPGPTPCRPCALAVLPFLLTGGSAHGQDRVQVFLEKSQALRAAFPDADQFLEWQRLLTSEEIRLLESRLHRTLPDGGYLVYLACQRGVPVGLALITAEVGKVAPFAFLVATDLELGITRIDVMDYRESHGSEVRRRVFLDQFRGRTAAQPLRLAREIEGVPGATLSSQAVTRGTRKALAVLEAWFPERSPAALTAGFRAAGASSLPAGGPTTANVAAQRPALGSILAVVVEPTPGVDAAAAVAACFTAAERLEGILSRHRADTELSRVNRDATQAPVVVSRELFALLAAALAARDQSRGAFDVTLGRGGGDGVLLDPVARTVRLRSPAVQLDLDGCGKGYVVDQLVELLRSRGVRTGRVGFRSSFRCFGTPADGRGWRVPMADGSECVLTDQALAVSSNAERDHVLDPRSGLPAPAVRDAVAIAPTAFAAEWLATAALVRGAAAVDGCPGGSVRFVAPALEAR